MKIDAVYFTIKKTFNNHLELRYSLRSLEKYVTGIRNTFVVGFQPDWCQNVIHVNKADTYAKNKDANIIEKVITCCNNKQISDPFLFINDDHFFSQKVRADQFGYYHKGELFSDSTNSLYRHRINKTKSMLKERNLPTLNYDVHTPILIHKKQFLEAFDGIDFIGTFMVMKSWYMNNWVGFDKGVEICDCKFVGSDRGTLLELKPDVKNRPCFSTSDNISKSVMNLLHCMFTYESGYEKGV